jgi:hypothetical protein
MPPPRPRFIRVSVILPSDFARTLRVVSTHSFSPSEAHYPATFQERGVAAPFTAPLLAGARIRNCIQDGIELIVPNPSGAPGTYVIPWSAAAEAYRPTLHDTMLLQRLAGPVPLHPRTVRAVAWEVAREGLAGDQARIAAEIAAQSDQSERLRAASRLLRALSKQVEPLNQSSRASSRRSAASDRQIDPLLRQLAPILGRNGQQIREAMASLSDLFAPVGLAPNDNVSRVARLIGQLRQTRDQMTKLSAPDHASGGDWLLRSVTTSMETILVCAQESFREARALFTDPLTLLKQWIATPAKVVALSTRTEWILDGWERISSLWQITHGDMARRGTVPEIAQLVPVLPQEVMQWIGAAVSMGALEPACLVTWQNDTWRKGGGAFVQIERNEQLRAISL